LYVPAGRLFTVCRNRFESVVCQEPTEEETIVGPGQAATVEKAPIVAEVLEKLQLAVAEK
jgi:hypothetical protein